MLPKCSAKLTVTWEKPWQDNVFGPQTLKEIVNITHLKLPTVAVLPSVGHSYSYCKNGKRENDHSPTAENFNGPFTSLHLGVGWWMLCENSAFAIKYQLQGRKLKNSPCFLTFLDDWTPQQIQTYTLFFLPFCNCLQRAGAIFQSSDLRSYNYCGISYFHEKEVSSATEFPKRKLAFQTWAFSQPYNSKTLKRLKK